MWQVMSDREKYKEMILDLSRQIASFRPASSQHISMLVEEMERRLSLLSDERAVLKVFFLYSILSSSFVNDIHLLIDYILCIIVFYIVFLIHLLLQ